jgi:16S rRNA (adenine1518-N6/adenine1519-N6)-dimethyltransferase
VHRPKKSLGQNFLQDVNAAQKIVRLFNPQPADNIMEIGPGKGALTSLILNAVPRITAIELDDTLSQDLAAQFGDKLTLIHDDVLNISFSNFSGDQNKLRLIGNIPYNITSPILFHVIDHRDAVKDFVVMMQTEVAQRLVAVPRTKEYGILSVFLQYYCSPKILFSISKNSFYPVPSVSSTIVYLDFTQAHAPTAANDQLFRKVVRGTFNTRRKTLRNGLRRLGVPTEMFESLSVDLDLRPEELTVQDFVTLSNELQNVAPAILNTPTEEAYD